MVRGGGPTGVGAAPGPAMSEDLDQVFLELQREYLAEAPGRVASLREAAARFRAGDPGAGAELRTQLHRLAGSGGSYGFPEISAIARELERLMTGGPQATDAAREGVERLAAAFRDAARELRPQPAAGGAALGRHAIAVMSPTALRDEVMHGLEGEGYLVRVGSRDDPGGSQVGDFPDLLVVAAEAGGGDPSAVASAWTGGAGRPRAVVLIELLRAVDRLRATAAGIDAVFSAERVAGSLPIYARTLARVGPPPGTVLVVDSEAQRADAVAAPLEEAGIQVVRCPKMQGVHELLEREVPDLLLLSPRLTDGDAESVARLVRGERRFALLPIIVIGEGGESAARLRALGEAADEVFAAPPDPHVLVRSVIGRAERGRRLREDRLRDPLTGLLNEATLLTELEHEGEYRRKHGGSAALLVLAIEAFDALAQRLGPEGSARVLRHVAAVVRSNVRASDLIGRYGEAELGLVLRGGTAEGAAVVAEKLRRVVGGHPAPVAGAEPITIQLRVGTAMFPSGLRQAGRRVDKT